MQCDVRNRLALMLHKEKGITYLPLRKTALKPLRYSVKADLAGLNIPKLSRITTVSRNGKHGFGRSFPGFQRLGRSSRAQSIQLHSFQPDNQRGCRRCLPTLSDKPDRYRPIRPFSKGALGHRKQGSLDVGCRISGKTIRATAKTALRLILRR